MQSKYTPNNSQSNKEYLLIFTTLFNAQKPMTNSELARETQIDRYQIKHKTKMLTKKGYCDSFEVDTEKQMGTKCVYGLTEKGKLCYQLLCNQFITFLF